MHILVVVLKEKKVDNGIYPLPTKSHHLL